MKTAWLPSCLPRSNMSRTSLSLWRGKCAGVRATPVAPIALDEDVEALTGIGAVFFLFFFCRANSEGQRARIKIATKKTRIETAECACVRITPPAILLLRLRKAVRPKHRTPANSNLYRRAM